MHQAKRHVTGIYFAYDREHFHIRLDFRSKNGLESIAGLKVVMSLFVPDNRVFEMDLGERRVDPTDEFRYACEDVLEFTVRRDHLWADGFGELSFAVTLTQDDQRLESWPEHEPIRVAVPRKIEEMFWTT